MLIGKELGPYVVETELGSGAMGTVFRARHKTAGERVAIKLMSIALGTNEMAVARFVREVAILKQMDHPNIVKYKGSGRYHKAPFYIMEYVEGESLDHILARRLRLTWEEIVEIGTHLCAALQHAHDKGIIHRDLKPSNLMVLKDGVVKLTDFGIAKDIDVTALTAVNSTVGTAAYMSPEQCRGAKDISSKTDLYSMGIMFYELVTGRKPFTGETAMEIFLQHAKRTDYARPAQWVMDVPPSLDALICQLMAKDPAKRPFNAAAVADALKAVKEKMDAQKSAGIEAATKRRIDRSDNEKKLDEEDKEAARIMLGRKKKKKRELPYYTKGWFTVLGLGMLIIVLSAVVYVTFIRTPSAESLASQAEAGMASDPKATREGPIADFLRYYPDHEKYARMRELADQYDFETLDRQMHNRRKSPLKFTLTPEEELFRNALDEEDKGALPNAAALWQQLSEKKANADPELRAWGLIGERYGLEIKNVENRYRRLKADQEKKDTSDPFERIALEAMHLEGEGKAAAAKSRWDELKGRSNVPRMWYLLAARRSHELQAVLDAAK